MTTPEVAQESRDDAASRQVRGFYDAALSESEKAALPLARRVEGLDQEIAVLRVRLRSVLEQHPESMDLIRKGVEVLVKALAANYRLSNEAKGDLSASVTALLEEFGDAVCPQTETENVAPNEDIG